MNTKNIIFQSNYNTILDSQTNDIKYVGPKAIFDPNFIPPRIINQKSIGSLLFGVISDALEDGYGTNFNIYGLKGAGKNLLINHFLNWVEANAFIEDTQSQKQRLNTKSQKIQIDKESSVIVLIIDCECKQINQILFSILYQLTPKIHPTFDINKFSALGEANLWNCFKILVNKSNRPIIIYLQKCDQIDNGFISQLFLFSKSNKNMQIITGLNTGTQKYAFKQYEAMDHKILLDFYKVPDLYTIAKERIGMTFKNQIAPEAIKLMIDYICEFDLKVPGSCINLIKEIYPVIIQTNKLSAEKLREISQYYFEGYSIDAITMANFVMESEFDDRLFLNNIINYFQNKTKYYIPFNELKRIFIITAEEMGFKPNQIDFERYLTKFINAGIIQPSILYFSMQKEYSQNKAKKSKFNNESIIMDMNSPLKYDIPYYLTIPLEEANEIIEASFGNFDSN